MPGSQQQPRSMSRLKSQVRRVCHKNQYSYLGFRCGCPPKRDRGERLLLRRLVLSPKRVLFFHLSARRRKKSPSGAIETIGKQRFIEREPIAWDTPGDGLRSTSATSCFIGEEGNEVGLQCCVKPACQNTSQVMLHLPVKSCTEASIRLEPEGVVFTFPAIRRFSYNNTLLVSAMLPAWFWARGYYGQRCTIFLIRPCGKGSVPEETDANGKGRMPPWKWKQWGSVPASKQDTLCFSFRGVSFPWNKTNEYWSQTAFEYVVLYRDSKNKPFFRSFDELGRDWVLHSSLSLRLPAACYPSLLGFESVGWRRHGKHSQNQTPGWVFSQDQPKVFL